MGEQMADRFLLNEIFDCYESLLTDNQRSVYDLYYLQDISLGEIAGEMSISRQAVHDLLKRTEKRLLNYEASLGLRQKNAIIKEIIAELEELPGAQSKDFALRLARTVY